MPTINRLSNSYTYVLNYPVDLVNEKQAIDLVEEAWRKNRGLHIITVNAEMIITAQKDSNLDRILHNADLVIPDGAGVVLAAKLNGHSINRLPGIELAQLCLERAAKAQIPVALIGGEPEISETLIHSLPLKYRGLKLSFTENGYFKNIDEEQVIEKIKKSGAQLILVAMGVPRQEYFIERARQYITNAVFIGVGGSFDVWAGKKQRAPKIWQDSHLEWLYRLICEPWRYKRMADSLPRFAWQVLINKIKKDV